MPNSDRRRVLVPRLDLGLVARARSWPELFAAHNLRRDIGQGLSLAAAMFPLSMLLANLAGAPASSGLISAALGSLVCALFGGTRPALSGPGLATALVCSGIIAKHGFQAFGMVVYLAAILQVATGVLGVGRFVRLAPLSVLRACVFGVGLVVLVRQLPHALGSPVEQGAGLLGQLDALVADVRGANAAVVAVAIGAGLLGALTAIRPRVPGPLLAVIGATLVVQGLGLEVPMVFEADAFPFPHKPLPPSGGFAHLLGSIFELWAVMTLATAINTVALEQLRADGGAERTDPDQELIAQGLASIALAFLQGLPVTQLVARSALAQRLGVSSSRPALVQALVLLVAALVTFPLLRLVPAASLTAIAIAVAVPLLQLRPLRALACVSRLELGISVATVAFMVLSGIVSGLAVGLAAAFGVAALRMARTRALVSRSTDPRAPHHVVFSGPITFLAALELDRLRADLRQLDVAPGLVIDLRSVIAMDGNGALALVSALDEWRARAGKVALLGPSMLVRDKLRRADEAPRELAASVPLGSLDSAIAPTDRVLDVILGKPHLRLARPHLLAGLTRFREELRGRYDTLFAELADGQQPHTMFITCADSRIDPALLMGSHPGDLFVVRAIGALVAPAGSAAMPQEGAALEYGVGVLGVRTIVVCGHSKCGAISALKKGHVPDELHTLQAWSKHASPVAGELASFADVDDAIRAVTVRQLENLMSYPLVRKKHEAGELELHAWFYDLGKVELFEWDPRSKSFAVLAAEPESAPAM